MTTLTNFLNQYLNLHGDFPKEFSNMIVLDENISYQATYATSSSYQHVQTVSENVVESIMNNIQEDKITPLITPEWFINRSLANYSSVFNKAFSQGHVSLARNILENHLANTKEYDYFSIYKICENSFSQFAHLNKMYSRLDVSKQKLAKDLFDRLIELAYECREKTIITNKKRKPLDLTQLMMMPINDEENKKKLYSLNVNIGKELINMMTQYDSKGIVFFDYLWNKLDNPRKEAILKHNQIQCEKYHLYGYDFFQKNKKNSSLVEEIVVKSMPEIFQYLQKQGVSLLDTNLNENDFLNLFTEIRKETLHNIVLGRRSFNFDSNQEESLNFKKSNELLELAEKDFKIIPKNKLDFNIRANLIYLNLLDDIKPLSKYDSSFNKSINVEIDEEKISLNNEGIKFLFFLKREFMKEFELEFKNINNDSSNERNKSAFESFKHLENIHLDKINLKDEEKEILQKNVFPQMIKSQLNFKIKSDKLNSMIENFIINHNISAKENTKKTSIKI